MRAAHGEHSSLSWPLLPLLHPLSREHSSQGFSTELSKHRTLSGLQMRPMGFWFPVPGGQPPQLPPADDRAVLHGDQGDLRRDSIQSRRQSAMRYKRAGLAHPAGRVWCGGGSDTSSPSHSPFWLLGHPPWSTSGGLFQGTDNLLQDVRAVIGYLLENGVGELLQFCIVPFNFLQLTLKLKEKGEMELRQRAA